MKNILFLISILAISTLNAQYSGYYDVNINQNVNATINKNVDVNGLVTVNKNISTIDYGKLALANSQNERTRLESLKYANARERQISLEIASNPIKAYDYGFNRTFIAKGKDAKALGFKKFTSNYRVPHNSLFVQAGEGRFENVSQDGITTEITISAPQYNTDNVNFDIEKMVNMDIIKVGQVNKKMGLDGEDIFVHRKDLNRATIFGVRGYSQNLTWEDDFQYSITDNYISLDSNKGNGIYYSVNVRYFGDKDEITFEQLEGRRYYLRRLIEKIISTAHITDMKY